MKIPISSADAWSNRCAAVARRWEAEYTRAAVDLPPEIEQTELFRDWASGRLSSRIASPFWELARFRRGQEALDLGCGFSFLGYPWRDWEVRFWGQEIAATPRQTLLQPAPQPNSKLFKGCRPDPAHQLDYPDASFDWVVLTGVTPYFPPAYWQAVLTGLKPLLRSGGQLLLDVLDPDSDLLDPWSLLELYLGAEVEAPALADWKALFKATGWTVAAEREGPLFRLMRLKLQ